VKQNSYGQRCNWNCTFVKELQRPDYIWYTITSFVQYITAVMGPICASCLEIWVPQLFGTLRVNPGYYRDCCTFLSDSDWAPMIIIIIILLWRCEPTRVMASSFLRFLDHTQRRTTVGRTPLDEWSARRRDLYLTTHNTHNRQTSMPRDRSRRAAADLRLRQRGHLDRQ
jgi:hypothetical protein